MHLLHLKLTVEFPLLNCLVLLKLEHYQLQHYHKEDNSD